MERHSRRRRESVNYQTVSSLFLHIDLALLFSFFSHQALSIKQKPEKKLESEETTLKKKREGERGTGIREEDSKE
jgi:hypothetical protein